MHFSLQVLRYNFRIEDIKIYQLKTYETSNKKKSKRSGIDVLIKTISEHFSSRKKLENIFKEIKNWRSFLGQKIPNTRKKKLEFYFQIKNFIFFLLILDSFFELKFPKYFFRIELFGNVFALLQNLQYLPVLQFFRFL